MDKIGMYIYAVLCGGMGILTSVYMVVSAVVVIAQKITRKVRYGTSMFD